MKPETRLPNFIRYAGVLMAVAALLAAAGCSGLPAMLKPASENASSIANLIWVTFGIAAVVFVIVEGVLMLTIARYRNKPGAGMPRQSTGNTAVEIAWTAIPAIALAVVFALTLGTLNYLTTAPTWAKGASPTQHVNVRIIGHEWWWEIQYPDLGITTANEIHVPVGADVSFKIESTDVIHSFWVPQMGGKTDAIPGHINNSWWHVTEAGRFTGQCAEYCGTEHALMRLVVYADPPDTFNAWMANQKSPPLATDKLAPDEKLGQQIVMTHACTACHYIQGTKAVGRIGPDLTHFASRSTFAGASFENHGVNVGAWVYDPQKMKPGNKMPGLGLSLAEAQMVAVYMESLK